MNPSLALGFLAVCLFAVITASAQEEIQPAFDNDNDDLQEPPVFEPLSNAVEGETRNRRWGNIGVASQMIRNSPGYHEREKAKCKSRVWKGAQTIPYKGIGKVLSFWNKLVC